MSEQNKPSAEDKKIIRNQLLELNTKKVEILKMLNIEAAFNKLKNINQQIAGKEKILKPLYDLRQKTIDDICNFYTITQVDIDTIYNIIQKQKEVKNDL